MSKIIVGYPSLPDTEALGRPQSAQNRQFQWFKEPTHIYPVIPAYAATMLKNAGREVVWLDGPAEQMSWKEYLVELVAQNPDYIAWEVKTPVVKRVWPLVDRIKKFLPRTKVILMGDHITALPQETLNNSKTDLCLTGGDYDFGLIDITNQGLEEGIIRKETTTPLASLPVIDRELTRWQNYAYKVNLLHSRSHFLIFLKMLFLNRLNILYFLHNLQRQFLLVYENHILVLL